MRCNVIDSLANTSPTGNLFASMCCAIIFVKVSRIQSFAQVEFSEPICIRYGMGVRAECDDDCKDSDNGSQSKECDDTLPCPILEFRVVNRMHNTAGGEIIDANVSVVACIEASQACPTVRGSSSTRRRGKKGKKGPRRSRVSSMRRLVFAKPLDRSSSEPIGTPTRSRQSSTSSLLLAFAASKLGIAAPNQAFEEDPSGRLVPKRILSKLECESHEHPFFKRVFTIRHTLDQNSPLLKAHPRQLVKQNHGFWPKELNSAEGVRGAIHFDHLLVSLTGTSNADANSVYSQKVYEFLDVNVGYRFVNMLYRDPRDGYLKVDTNLLNDVMEQTGGGGEPFSFNKSGQVRDVLIL
jgi:hypothetical protein